MLEPLSLAAGLSWGSGLRLYLTVLIAGVFGRAGFIHLPDTLSVLQSPWVIGAAALLTLTEFLADKIPAFDSLWDAVQQRMGELLPHALGMIQWVQDQFEEIPFDNDPEEIIQYAADRAQRRLGAIESARGMPVEQIDLDYSPEHLEETFGEEDAKAIAEIAASLP